jgi:hypothetical protein
MKLEVKCIHTSLIFLRFFDVENIDYFEFEKSFSCFIAPSMSEICDKHPNYQQNLRLKFHDLTFTTEAVKTDFP